MTGSGHIALIDRLRVMPTETQRFEFKHNRYEPRLVEGRYPGLMVAGTIAKATGAVGRHIRERGFYLDLILALVREHGPVARSDVDELLVPKLPDRLTPDQKRRKVRNLLQELRRAGKIVNLGSRSQPQWSGQENHVD